MTPLEDLRNAFVRVNVKLASGSFGDVGEMKRVADSLERSFGQGRAPDQGLILRTLKKLLETGTLSGYREIKTACYGLLTPIRGTLAIVTNIQGLESFLGLVDKYESEPKRLKRCFQALMNAYFSLDGIKEDAPAHTQWQILRLRLSAWLPKLANLHPLLEWLRAALQHQSLFGDRPTEKFGASVFRGDSSEFESACDQLSIPQDSWVRRRVIISAIETAASQNDKNFESYLEKAIALLSANPSVRSEGLALLLNRYAKSTDTPEHILLRTSSLDAFGNPLIVANKPRWFGVSDDAQEMVARWLKGFLIERFFELLSNDGHTDKRRPKFWLRHRNSITNMWFVLGTSAMSSWNDEFRKLRSAMGNQCLSLQGASQGNNAFVMKLGDIYAVEFGEKGNATFLYDGSNLPFDLSARWLELTELKSADREMRLLHKDGIEKWEAKFSKALSQYGIVPDTLASDKSRTARATVAMPPRPVIREDFLKEFKKFCNERTIRYDDRAPSGRLVVYTQLDNSAISKQLSQWGFYFDKGERRWIKKP